MKKNLLFTILNCAIVFAFAQEYELKPDQFKGEIYMKKGGSRTGYIDMKGSDMSPWANQQSVKFFSDEAVADGKVQGKEKEKFKPKTLNGYKSGDRYFESIKISAAKLSTGIGMASQKFVERLVDGKIKLYKLYEAPDPAGVYVGEEEIARHEQELERMRNEPLMVLQKGDGKYILLRKANLSEMLSDCPDVQAKYDGGEYGIEPWNPDAETKLGKMIANQTNAEQVEAILPEILNDYNSCK